MDIQSIVGLLIFGIVIISIVANVINALINVRAEKKALEIMRQLLEKKAERERMAAEIWKDQRLPVQSPPKLTLVQRQGDRHAS